MLRAILFDLDGTLIEFKFDWKGSRLEMIDWLRENNFDTTAITPVTRTQAILDIVRSQIDQGNGLPDFASVKNRLMEIVDKYEVQSCLDAAPYPGTIPLLEKLRENSIKTCLVTNSGRRAVQFSLEQFKLAPLLKSVITREDVLNMKPMPEGILMGLEALGVEKDEAIFVGDSVEDLKASKAARLRSVALARNEGLVSALLEQQPDFLIRKIDELDPIVFGQLER